MTFAESNSSKTSSVLGDAIETLPPLNQGSGPSGAGSEDDWDNSDGGGRFALGRRKTLLALTLLVAVLTGIVAFVVVTFGAEGREQSLDSIADVDRVIAGGSEQSTTVGPVDTLAPLQIDGLAPDAYGSDVTIGSSAIDAEGQSNPNPTDAGSTGTTASSATDNSAAGTSSLPTEADGAGGDAGSGQTATSAEPTTSNPATTEEVSTTIRVTTNPATTEKPTTTRNTTTTRQTTTTRRATTSQQTTTTRRTTTTRNTTTTQRPTTTRQTTTTRPTTTTAKPTTTTRLTTTTAPSSGRLIWEENFNSLDTSSWKVEHSTYGDGNNELQCYRPENVSVANGKLTLRAVTETYTCPNGSTRSVTSGMVRSRGVTFSPGQAIEFRVKLNPADPNDQSGLWPAVWSSGWAGGGWPKGGELDYLEVMTAENPNRAMFSMHYADESGNHEHQNKGVIGSEYFSNSWHTIRFEYGWGGNLVWYLDGVESFRVNSAATLQGYPAPFDQSTNEIKINLALGGRPGPLSSGAVGSAGASFEVDFVRIYEL